MTIGLYRDDGWVMIRDHGGNEVLIRRDAYMANGYQPSYDKLPTKRAYEAEKAGGRA